jgi:hypothetical protein
MVTENPAYGLQALHKKIIPTDHTNRNVFIIWEKNLKIGDFLKSQVTCGGADLVFGSGFSCMMNHTIPPINTLLSLKTCEYELLSVELLSL